MTAVTRPRGHLPSRVYWFRRLLVLVVVLALVFGLARLLGGTGGGGPSARPVGAEAPATSPATTAAPATPATPSATPSSTPDPADTVPTLEPTPTIEASAGAGRRADPTPTELASPEGTCAASDVVATPSVASPSYAGGPVVLTVGLTTATTPACTWVVSPASLVVKVTSGTDRFWSTQDCPGAVPKQSVVVRSDVSTAVPVAWNGLRSDSDCSRSTAWAEPGSYHVVAAAYGADAADEQFRLLTPVGATVTRSPKPTPRPDRR